MHIDTNGPMRARISKNIWYISFLNRRAVHLMASIIFHHFYRDVFPSERHIWKGGSWLNTKTKVFLSSAKPHLPCFNINGSFSLSMSRAWRSKTHPFCHHLMAPRLHGLKHLGTASSIKPSPLHFAALFFFSFLVEVPRKLSIIFWGNYTLPPWTMSQITLCTLNYSNA